MQRMHARIPMGLVKKCLRIDLKSFRHKKRTSLIAGTRPLFCVLFFLLSCSVRPALFVCCPGCCVWTVIVVPTLSMEVVALAGLWTNVH